MCFGVNPDTRVHPGILIPGDCWVSTLPAASADAAADISLEPPSTGGSAASVEVWIVSFRLKKKEKRKIQVEGLLAIFSAKSKMDDLCPRRPEVRCQGSDVVRLK